MLREGTEKILSRRGTRGEDGRKVKKMLLMLQSCLFAVVVVTLSPGGGLRPVDPLYIERERESTNNIGRRAVVLSSAMEIN